MKTNPFRALVQKLGRQKWFAATFRGIAPHVDRFLYKATKGRVATLTGTGLPTLLLTTTGRKSGQPRTVPLLYGERNGAYIVVGSNWGQEHHPAWSTNLVADPNATVQIRGCADSVCARQIEGDERQQVWDDVMMKIWPGYENYAERSGRHIRIFALEPKAKV
jgi:deazaflavin-dependent oxidoreductase (nitroreductase family)